MTVEDSTLKQASEHEMSAVTAAAAGAAAAASSVRDAEDDEAPHSSSSRRSSSSSSTSSKTKRALVLRLLQQAAAKAVGEGDPWAAHQMHLIPAERVVRHLYHPRTGTWSRDETIVKIQSESFTHGAMRYCFRLKKRAQPPNDASVTNHHYHSKIGWAFASNYVAKAYYKANGAEIDCSEAAKQAVRNDIMLQYEAQHWSEQFNQQRPPTKIHFIRAYAIEFPNRPGQPWLAVERFIAGTDLYGAGFVKHNTNGGFVDTELRRVTPQIFSAFTFYQSHGTRLVADIQGVGDLYTDPQVLSDDYRFGDGDLGPRGMALFFHSYRSCGSSDAMGIPIFPLSRNEIKAQAKYEDEEVTVSECDIDEQSLLSNSEAAPLDAFQRLDWNRQRRRASLQLPPPTPLDILLSPSEKDTLRHSNVAVVAAAKQKQQQPPQRAASIRDQLRQSLAAASPTRRTSSVVQKPLRRTQSDTDEVQLALKRAQTDRGFSHHDFHRKASGDLRERQFRDDNGDTVGSSKHNHFHKSAIARTVSAPMTITDLTKTNLGKVHYQLAILHGAGRFPECCRAAASPSTTGIPSIRIDDDDDDHEHHDDTHATTPDHDAFSVLFHLSHAASLRNAPACLALGRVQAGLATHVSHLLHYQPGNNNHTGVVPTDLDAAKRLLHRAMMTTTTTATATSGATATAAAASPRPPRGAYCFRYCRTNWRRAS